MGELIGRRKSRQLHLCPNSLGILLNAFDFPNFWSGHNSDDAAGCIFYFPLLRAKATFRNLRAMRSPGQQRLIGHLRLAGRNSSPGSTLSAPASFLSTVTVGLRVPIDLASGKSAIRLVQTDGANHRNEPLIKAVALAQSWRTKLETGTEGSPPTFLNHSIAAREFRCYGPDVGASPASLVREIGGCPPASF